MTDLKLNIMVVDDDPLIGELMVDFLSNIKYDVTFFTSGRKALEYLKDNPVNLILTDLCMPEMNGLDVIKAAKKTRPNLPIITMSGSFGSEMIDELSKLGVSNHLKKPFTLSYLEQVITQNLHSKK